MTRMIIMNEVLDFTGSEDEIQRMKKLLSKLIIRKNKIGEIAQIILLYLDENTSPNQDILIDYFSKLWNARVSIWLLERELVRKAEREKREQEQAEWHKFWEYQEESISLEKAYQILEIDSNTSWKSVRLSFIKKAKIFHPDKGGNKEKMQELNAAFKEVKKRHGRKDREGD